MLKKRLHLIQKNWTVITDFMNSGFQKDDISQVSCEGIEIGAVSVKWVRLKNNDISVEYAWHGGNPEKIIDQMM
jgi:hypothetical protein